ncbi:MAG TPA: DotU family type IV/VI secretion system protein [Geomonas sp.]|nr:DotU family type IV/VI secretion system protein [Geomonas sp.]
MHLTDCFIELFAFITQFRQRVATSQPPLEQVKETALSLMAKSGELASQGEFAACDVEAARFAVCAWADEALANSEWHHRHLWLKERLQQTHFNTTDAGEEFFQRLAALKPPQREVREVYYLCLVLGFTGRFCKSADQWHLQKLKESNLKLLIDGSLPGFLDQSPLFPAAYPPGSNRAVTPKRFSFSLPTLSALLAPLLVFLTMFVVYRITLGTVADTFLKTVTN